MIILFYIAAIVAVISTLCVILQSNIVHALIYLILSLLAVAVIFYVLGAPFAAMLEAIVYAGAIMVLFLFVIMMLKLNKEIKQYVILKLNLDPVQDFVLRGRVKDKIYLQSQILVFLI